MATNTEKVVVQVIVKGGKQLDNLTKKTGAATKKTGSLQKELTKMAAKTFAAATAFRLISQAVASAIKTFTAFEFQMAKVKAISGANNIEFKALTESAQELGRTTFFTATQVAELQSNFAKLGFTTSEIMNAQEATLLLATATGSDLARAAIVAGSAVRGFGLDASETERVVDVMAVAFTSSALDIEKWQTSMTKIAPIAAGANISIETSAAIMGKLSDAGIEASIAGTSLRNIFLKMQDSASDLSKHLGFTVNSSDDLEKALKQLNAEGLSNEEIMGLVDLRQVAAFKTMVDGTSSIIDMTDALENSSGAGSEMAGIVGDNLEGAFKRLMSAVEGLEIAIMDGFIGKALRGIVEKGAEVLNFLTNAAEGFDSINDKIATSARIYKAQGTQLQSMADRYDVLSKSTKRTADEEEELQGILVKLQEEFGRSVISVDNKTDALNLNRSALDKVISRTALLADTEALKLVHKLKNTRKEISLEQEKKDALDGTVESITSNVGIMAEMMNSQAALSDQTGINNIQYDEFGNVIDRAVNNSNDLIDAQDSSAAQAAIINELKEDEILLIEQLTEAGWSEKEITDLLNQSITTNTKKREENKTVVDDEIKSQTIYNKITEQNLKDILSLQDDLLSSKITQAEFDEELARRQIQLLDNVLRHSILTDEERMKLTKKRNDLQIAGIDKELTALEKLKMAQEVINAIIDSAQKNDDRRTSRAIKNLEERKESGIINQEQYEAEVEKIERAAFAREKKRNISKALMNTALGITEAFPNVFKMAFVAAMGLIQVNAIQNEQYALGGMIEEFANGGMVQGKSHAQGGEKFAVGGRVVELEGGEAVINKRSTAMFSSQLSAMNSAGGGVKFADGGLLNQPSFSQQQFSALGQNQMMGAMGGSSKVVVVEADITDSQNTVSVIQSQATI